MGHLQFQYVQNHRQLRILFQRYSPGFSKKIRSKKKNIKMIQVKLTQKQNKV